MPAYRSEMRFVLIFLAALVTLSACTQRDICISQATRDLRVLDGLIAETRATLRRGYAVEERVIETTRTRGCRLADGTVGVCTVEVPTTVRTPVAVDLDAERRKLDSMLARREGLVRETEAAVRACQAAYPEG